MKKSLLWKISQEELPGDSYLFGTMHVKDRRAFQYRELVYSRINQCDAFAIEFDLEEMGSLPDPSFLLMPGGGMLDQFISGRRFEKMRRMFLKGVGLDIHAYRRFKPILISNLISERILSSDEAFSLDEHLWHYAKTQEKQTLGIETYREQQEIMNQIPIDEQVRALVGMARNFSRHRRQLLRMAELYQSGDPLKIFKASKHGAGKYRKLLLYNRNKLIAERITGLIGVQTVFCAIGAGHLGGKKGVLRLLKLKGFHLTPVQLESQ